MAERDEATIAVRSPRQTTFQLLNSGHVLAVRVALVDLEERMKKPGALGADEHGERMRTGYLARARELLALLVVALAAVACSACKPEPPGFPVLVVVSDALTATERADLEASAQAWNEALAAPLFVFEGEPGADEPDACDVVRVVKHAPKSKKPASTTLHACGAVLYLHPEAAEMVPQRFHVAMFAHELGHLATGMGHSRDPSDLMAEEFTEANASRPELISEANVAAALRNPSIRRLVEGVER